MSVSLTLINTPIQSTKTTIIQIFKLLSSNKMQFSTIFFSAVALFGSMALAAPSEDLNARSSCQVGDIWGAGDAACSASVCVSRKKSPGQPANMHIVP